MASVDQLLAILLLLLANLCAAAAAASRCKCLPSDSCWPCAESWSQLNASVGGRLLQPKPPASPCYDVTLDSVLCSLVRSRNSDPFWRADHPGAMQYTNWESRGAETCPLNSTLAPSRSCSQGNIPEFSVNASSIEDIQAAVRFAARHSIRLIVKNKSHDYLGRSTAAGALGVWTHYLRDITFFDAWVPRGACGDTRGVAAVTTAAGDSWGDVYKRADVLGVVVAGAMPSSVGTTGGYVQGGGHGPLSHAYGLAADNLLEAVVVTAQGDVVVANDCQNQDLFWALRGGGGGTFGIVVYATHRTHPAPPRGAVGVAYGINTTQASDTALHSVVRAFAALHPRLSDAGFSGYFSVAASGITFGYHVLNGNDTAAVENMLSPFTEYAASLAGVTVVRGFVKQYPSFLAWRKDALCVFFPGTCTETTGKNVMVASTLVPRTTLEASPAELASTLISILRDGVVKRMVGCFVAGGSVAVTTTNSSANPAWRKALWQLVLPTGWPDGTTIDVQRDLARGLTLANIALKNVSSGAGSYLNEADFHEPDWQSSLFGAHYPRLKAIKMRVDPEGLFLCHHCVGSEDWTDDLTCPRNSQP